jgi:hypothetical protein
MSVARQGLTENDSFGTGFRLRADDGLPGCYSGQRSASRASPPARFLDKSRKLSEIRASSNSLRRRNFRSCDSALGTQSHANPIRLPGAGQSDHFPPQNRLAFAFRPEWTANRNRTDCKALTSEFSVKFSGKVCYLQLTISRGLAWQNRTEGSNPLRSASKS